MAEIKEVFWHECHEFANRYSSVVICGTEKEELEEVIKKAGLDPEYDLCNGFVMEDGSIFFNVFKGDTIHDAYNLSMLLPDATVYSWTDWDESYLVSFKNGHGFSNFSAEWEIEAPTPYREGGCVYWDCDVVITDNATGTSFLIGGGCMEIDRYQYFKYLVDTHPKE